ncbi:MAG: tail fiber domain-containing protein, partial [Planctomycetota bacterium]
VRLINAEYNPAAGIDQNLLVDRIKLNGKTYQTDSSAYVSRGRVSRGNSEKLITNNAMFQFVSEEGKQFYEKARELELTDAESFESWYREITNPQGDLSGYFEENFVDQFRTIIPDGIKDDYAEVAVKVGDVDSDIADLLTENFSIIGSGEQLIQSTLAEANKAYQKFTELAYSMDNVFGTAIDSQTALQEFYVGAPSVRNLISGILEWDLFHDMNIAGGQNFTGLQSVIDAISIRAGEAGIKVAEFNESAKIAIENDAEARQNESLVQGLLITLGTVSGGLGIFGGVFSTLSGVASNNFASILSGGTSFLSGMVDVTEAQLGSTLIDRFSELGGQLTLGEVSSQFQYITGIDVPLIEYVDQSVATMTSAITRIEESNFELRASLVNQDPGKYGNLIGERLVSTSWYSARRDGDAGVSLAIQRVNELNSKYPDSEYKIDTWSNHPNGSTRSVRIYYVETGLPTQTEQENQQEIADRNSLVQALADHKKRQDKLKPSFPSDRRIKTGIEIIGWINELKIAIYSWKYRSSDPTRYVGVMAQDLLERKDLKHAVRIAQEGEFAGFYEVDYGSLGLRMTTETEWLKLGKSKFFVGDFATI